MSPLDDETLLPQEDEQEMFEHFRLVADKGQAPLRVDKFITTHQEDTSRNRVQQAIKLGYVLVNDKPAKANTIIRPCDVIKFVMPYQRRGVEILPENIPLNIAYEDDDVLVINKPAGMVVHPGHGNYTGTLVNALAYYLGISQGPDGEDERLGVLVHRIDKDTSGLLVVAKNPQAQAHLADQFFVHSIDRVYTAVVWGNIAEDEGTIQGTIGRDTNDRLRFRVYDDPEKGKWAVTHWKVLERYGFITVVECRLETGRTHQIASTCPPSAIPSSTTNGMAVPKSARAPSTPNTASSSRTASPSAPGRPSTPAPWASPIPAPGSASSSRLPCPRT